MKYKYFIFEHDLYSIGWYTLNTIYGSIIIKNYISDRLDTVALPYIVNRINMYRYRYRYYV